MSQMDEMMERLRNAFKDRALYLALLYRSFSRALPSEEVEKLAREAIFEFGRIKGRADGAGITAEEWVTKTPTEEDSVFGTSVVKDPEGCKEIMTSCPLVEAWQEIECNPEEISLLCDIAMEVDRGRADFHDLYCDLPRRISKGDEHCCLILRNRENTP